MRDLLNVLSLRSRVLLNRSTSFTECISFDSWFIPCHTNSVMPGCIKIIKIIIRVSPSYDLVPLSSSCRHLFSTISWQEIHDHGHSTGWNAVDRNFCCWPRCYFIFPVHSLIKLSSHATTHAVAVAEARAVCNAGVPLRAASLYMRVGWHRSRLSVLWWPTQRMPVTDNIFR